VTPLTGRAILVVDQDASWLDRWRLCLLAQGARVICSAGIDSALANAITFPAGTFHAVVIEHRPCGLDAFELGAALRALPAMDALPLIVLASADTAAATQASVASAVLLRPVTAEQLTARLAAEFASSSLSRQRAGARQREHYRGTILVAEDDPVNAECMRAMLVALGFEVEHAQDGAEAIGRSATRGFDLILMDAEMPQIDGLEATRRIRAREAAQGTRQPIVCVTANRIDSYRERCAQAGMDDFVAKPVGPSALLAVLARWLSPHRRSNGALGQANGAERPLPRPSGPIDWGQVESLRSVDPGGVNGILGKAIGLYLEHAPKLIERILTYRVTGDLTDVQRAAHSLRSSSASLGAAEVARLSETIEAAAAKSDFEIIDSVAAALETEYRRAERALCGALPASAPVQTLPCAAQRIGA